MKHFVEARVHLERLSAPGRVAQRNGSRWTRRKASRSWSASAAANMSNLFPAHSLLSFEGGGKEKISDQ